MTRMAAVAALVGGMLSLTGCATRTVLFDQGHNERFQVGKSGPLDLSGLGDRFRAQGVTVSTLDTPLTDEALAGTTALVISGPFQPLTPAEVACVGRFLDRGGRLAVMLHIGPPVGELLHALGVDFSNAILRERQDIIDNDPANFRVTRLEAHPLFAGVKRFSLYGGWALMGYEGDARIIASTSPEAWVDLNGDRKLGPEDAVQSFGVVVAGSRGKGAFLVFGDDAIFQNKFQDDDNRQLADNLVRWLNGAPR